MHLAQIAHWIQMTNVDKKDRGKLSDFLLFRKKPAEQESLDQRIRATFGILKKDK